MRQIQGFLGSGTVLTGRNNNTACSPAFWEKKHPLEFSFQLSCEESFFLFAVLFNWIGQLPTSNAESEYIQFVFKLWSSSDSKPISIAIGSMFEYIYLQFILICLVINVGWYASPMDPMGYDFLWGKPLPTLPGRSSDPSRKKWPLSTPWCYITGCGKTSPRDKNGCWKWNLWMNLEPLNHARFLVTIFGNAPIRLRMVNDG